ncbi:MAG: hypothetical protein HY554_00825 [Elusimicrobia bacterium]|nr:hypothetical protein [Elusimicrobiota bacterium]
MKLRRLQAAPLAGLLLAATAAVARAVPLAAGQSRTLPGTLEVVSEDLLDGSEVRHVGVRTQHGVVALDAASVGEDVQSGGDAEVSVFSTGEGLELLGVRLPEWIPIHKPGRKERVAVILLRFSRDGEAIATPFTRKEVETVVFGEGNRYLEEVSYGKLRIEGTVVGFYTLPFAPTCDTEEISRAALPLADRQLDYRKFDRVVMAYPNNNCRYGGMGTVGKTKIDTREGQVQVSLMWMPGEISLRIFAHEYGHNLGLWHASSLWCDRPGDFGLGCADEEYGDPYDAMGFPFPGHFGAHNKAAIGWLSGRQVMTVEAGRPRTVVARLTPVETRDGLKEIVIPVALPDGQAFAYHVEYRQPLGMDREVGLETDGALVRMTMGREDDASRCLRTHLLPMPQAGESAGRDRYVLRAGSRYEDPISRVSIVVLRRLGNGLSVAVTVGASAPSARDSHGARHAAGMASLPFDLRD